MATRSDQGAFARAFARNAALFMIGHFLFRGNEVLWVVVALVLGIAVGATGMWCFRHAHSGSMLEAITRPGRPFRSRVGAPGRPVPRRARS